MVASGDEMDPLLGGLKRKTMAKCTFRGISLLNLQGVDGFGYGGNFV